MPKEEKKAEVPYRQRIAKALSLPVLRPATSSLADWKAWAWKTGALAVSQLGKAATDSYAEVVLETARFTLRHDESVADVAESYWTSVRRNRKPLDAPERAWECVKWYESRWGSVSPGIRHEIGRGAVYPRLMLMAYCLGHDGLPFAFAGHRIGSVAGCNQNTVRRFVAKQLDTGAFILVREGVRGLGGQAAWYRLQSVGKIEEILHLNKFSPRPGDKNISFFAHMRKTMGFGS